MKDQNVKPMYVGVNEVCADWGCSRSKAACFGGQMQVL